MSAMSISGTHPGAHKSHPQAAEYANHASLQERKQDRAPKISACMRADLGVSSRSIHSQSVQSKGFQTVPILKNARHEAFAQALAKGETQADSYVIAGFKACDGHAARLAGNGRIKARVAEILGKAAQRAEVTIQSLADDLDEAQLLAHEVGQPSAIVAAVIGKARLFGMIVDKRDVTVTHQYAEMPDAELDAEIARMAAQVHRGGAVAH
jgi:hypothetical protein